MNQAVVCIAPNVVEAEKEVNNLRAVGFKNDDISVLWPDAAGAQELGYEQHTRAPLGIAWGAAVGSLLGGLQAYLAVSGIITCPWSNGLINAGPWIGTLSGVAVGGILGYLLGWSIGSAFPLYEAKKYERKIKVGSTLVAVHTDSADEAKIAREALQKTEAFGIHHIEEAGRRRAKCTVSGEKNMVKTTATLLALLAAITCSAALADSSVVAPATTPTSKIDAKISPQAKVDEQKATMPPDATSVKALNKDQSDNLDASDQVKVDKALTKTDNNSIIINSAKKDKVCKEKKSAKNKDK